MSHDLFLSYSRKNQERVLELYRALEARGLKVWLDLLENRVGDLLAMLKQAVHGAQALVQVLTPESLESDWVEKERDWGLEAFQRATEAGGTYRIIPIRAGVGMKNTRPLKVMSMDGHHGEPRRAAGHRQPAGFLRTGAGSTRARHRSLPAYLDAHRAPRAVGGRRG